MGIDSTTREKARGQGIVEFALAIPIILMLFLGLIEFGRFVFIYASIATASREASRYGAAAGVNDGGTLRYLDCTGIRAAAIRLGTIAGVDSADVAISYDGGAGSATLFSSCEQLVGSTDDLELGDRIVVQVTTSFTPLSAWPLLNLPSFDITSISRRILLKSIVLIGEGAPAGGGGPTSTPIPTFTATPTATLGASPTPTASPTVGNTPTATATSAATPTATATQTTPLAPLYVSVSSVAGSGNKCTSIAWTWQPNPDWASNPGGSPVNYQVFEDSISRGYVSPADPNPTTWNPGGQLNNNSTVTYSVLALFSGPLGSEQLSKTYLCDKGTMVEQ